MLLSLDSSTAPMKIHIKNPKRVIAGHIGGKASAMRLSPAERTVRAKKAVEALWANKGKLRHRDRDWLIAEYVKAQKSLGQISRETGKSVNTLKIWLTHFGIPLRKPNDDIIKEQKVHRGNNHPRFKGHRFISNGRAWIFVGKTHPQTNSKGYMLEHRFIMSQVVGHDLLSDEHVHHIDNNKLNNELSNLRLLSQRDHFSLHSKERIRDKEGRFICS